MFSPILLKAEESKLKVIPGCLRLSIPLPEAPWPLWTRVSPQWFRPFPRWFYLQAASSWPCAGSQQAGKTDGPSSHSRDAWDCLYQNKNEKPDMCGFDLGIRYPFNMILNIKRVILLICFCFTSNSCLTLVTVSCLKDLKSFGLFPFFSFFLYWIQKHLF